MDEWSIMLHILDLSRVAKRLRLGAHNAAFAGSNPAPATIIGVANGGWS